MNPGAIWDIWSTPLIEGQIGEHPKIEKLGLSLSPSLECLMQTDANPISAGLGYQRGSQI